MNILLLGGTGFVGRHVCEKLVEQMFVDPQHGEEGSVTVPSRRPQRAKALKPLPNIQLAKADVHDEAQLVQLMQGRDAVVNLVAILHGSEAAFRHVHVELPRKIVRACAAAGVRRVVHMSAIGADRQAPSRYLRSKAWGEEVLRESGLALTVLRPSVIFGEDDEFINRFARLQRLFPLMPLAGSQAKFQPVWVQDVAQAIVTCLERRDTVAQTYECVGPRIYTLEKLVRDAGKWSGHARPVIALPAALGRLQAALMECLPGEPLMSRDNLDSMKVDSVATHHPRLDALGIRPTALEAVMPEWFARHAGPARLDAWRKRATHF